MNFFVLWVFLVFVVGDGDGGSSIWWVHLSCCCESAAAAETTGQEFKFSPMAEYERRIASGDVHPGDKFQVCVCVFSRSLSNKLLSKLCRRRIVVLEAQLWQCKKSFVDTNPKP
jgi:hypothetical protein